MCSCTTCTRARSLERTIKSGSRHRIMREVKEVLEHLECSELDNDVNRMIFQGTWPGSVKILERALVKAREHEQKEAVERPRKRPVPTSAGVSETAQVS
jgi:hypothetical protein